MSIALRHTNAEGVVHYKQASDWVSDHAEPFETRVSEQGIPLSDYHRFAWHRLLVTLLHEVPKLIEVPLPPAIVGLLTVVPPLALAVEQERAPPSQSIAPSEQRIALLTAPREIRIPS